MCCSGDVDAAGHPRRSCPLAPSQEALVQQLICGSSAESSSGGGGAGGSSGVGVLDAEQVMLLRQLLGLVYIARCLLCLAKSERV
jgi:hypothetical protein